MILQHFWFPIWFDSVPVFLIFMHDLTSSTINIVIFLIIKLNLFLKRLIMPFSSRKHSLGFHFDLLLLFVCILLCFFQIIESIGHKLLLLISFCQAILSLKHLQAYLINPSLSTDFWQPLLRIWLRLIWPSSVDSRQRRSWGMHTGTICQVSRYVNYLLCGMIHSILYGIVIDLLIIDFECNLLFIRIGRQCFLIRNISIIPMFTLL